MNYRRITEKVADNLTLQEIYGYYVLATKSDFNTLESKINQTTLAEICGVNERTVMRWISKYEENDLLTKTTENLKRADGQWVKKNTYKLNDENYKYISDGLLNLPESNELKGFLILVKSRCYNCTNHIDYSIRALADTVKASKSTIDRYMKEALDKGYIKKAKTGYDLTDSDTFIIAKESTYYAVSKVYPNMLTDEDIECHQIFNNREEYEEYYSNLLNE